MRVNHTRSIWNECRVERARRRIPSAQNQFTVLIEYATRSDLLRKAVEGSQTVKAIRAVRLTACSEISKLKRFNARKFHTK